MIDATQRLRVLLIGAGQRIQNNYLPALTCAADHFEIVGIHSRTHEKLAAVARRWSVSAIARLEEFDFSTVDVVAVSVPTAQNIVVLKKLLPHAGRLRLVIDMPIVRTYEDHAASLPLLDRFKTVTVAEDYMNFPRFRLVREVVRTGLIGDLRDITLYNIGWLYHGLALLRSFVGFGPVLSTWRRSLNANATVTGYAFEHGVAATVVGPYRRHTTGGIYLTGSEGIITESPIDKVYSSNGKPTYVLSRVSDQDGPSKFEIVGEGKAFSLDVSPIKQMLRMNFSDKSDINIERGCGLIDVFLSLVDSRSINCAYTMHDAFYDSFVSQRAQDGTMPLDPFDILAANGCTVQVQRQSWTALTDTFLKAAPVPSATLSESEKIGVAAGAVVELEMAEATAGHLAILNAMLNGEPLAGGRWFLFPQHWAPE